MSAAACSLQFPASVSARRMTAAQYRWALPGTASSRKAATSSWSRICSLLSIGGILPCCHRTRRLYFMGANLLLSFSPVAVAGSKVVLGGFGKGQFHGDQVTEGFEPGCAT